MALLRFSDGVSIETNCYPRLLKLHDGYYAVGNRQLIPCENREEALEMVEALKVNFKKED